MTTATHSMTFNKSEGPVGQLPSSHTGCGRLTRQNAQTSITADSPKCPNEHHCGNANDVRSQRCPARHRNRTRNAKQNHGPGPDATQSYKGRKNADSDRTASRNRNFLFLVHNWLPIVAIPSKLNWRAAHGAERTIHTAVTTIRFQELTTARTVIEELAGVDRHAFACLVPTVRAGDDRVFNKFSHLQSSFFGTRAAEGVC